jgi:glycosyltransferase involved in cell wall biosynthesis
MNDVNSTELLRILVLEPYFGGSHKIFIQELARHLPFAVDLYTLPARNWKWRMRLAAPFFAERLQNEGKRYDRILCSTFVDVATLRTLSPSWINDVPVLTYYHENQFAYPVRRDDERDYHFALTNVTTALASDRVAFNSAYNLGTFLAGADDLLKKAPDMQFPAWQERIRAKTTILPPALDFEQIDQVSGTGQPLEANRPPVIIWNHRWEHDKDPELFFETIFALTQQGVHFRVIVLGQSFAKQPAIFAEAKKRLADRILHFGHMRSRRQYLQLLQSGDFVVSTARHEFFGMAVLEAVRAGCRPLLPYRLSYPEIFAKEFLYKEGELEARLAELLRNGTRLDRKAAFSVTEPFSWPVLAGRYQDWLTDDKLGSDTTA